MVETHFAVVFVVGGVAWCADRFSGDDVSAVCGPGPAWFEGSWVEGAVGFLVVAVRLFAGVAEWDVVAVVLFDAAVFAAFVGVESAGFRAWC